MELKINSEYKSLMPELPEDEFESLKNSIQKHSYWEEYPIIVNDNYEILDGHTRYKACQELDIEPTIKVKHFEKKEDEIEFVIEANLSRRHLKPFQKAELALKLLEIEKVRGEAKMKAKLKQFAEGPSAFPEEGEAVDSWRKVSEKVGVSKDTIGKTKEILEKGDEELIEKCRKGEVSVTEAYRKIKEKEGSKVKLVRPEDIFSTEVVRYLSQQSDLQTLIGNIKAIHSFLSEILNLEFMRKKELKPYVKKIEDARTLLGEITNYCLIVLKRTKGEK